MRRPKRQRGRSVLLVTVAIALSASVGARALAAPLSTGADDSMQVQPVPSRAPPPASVAGAGLVGAQDERVLAGHRFFFPLLQETAFNTTHFGIRQGGGSYSVPKYPTKVGTFDVEEMFLTEGADLAVRLHDRIGVFGTLEGQAFTGSDGTSALVRGGKFAVGGTFGGVVKLARIEQTGTQFAGRVFGKIDTGTKLNVLKLLDWILESDSSTLDEVINGEFVKYAIADTGSHEYGLSFHGAQALARYFSLQGSVRYAHGGWFVKATTPRGTLEDSSSTDDLQLVLAAEVDGMPAHVPVAAVMEYRIEGIWTTNDATDVTAVDSHHVISAGVYYSGQRNLQLGIALETEISMTPERDTDEDGRTVSSGSPSRFSGQFVFRYIWPGANDQ